MKEKICSVCGSVFMPKCSEQKYCSKPCGDKAGHELLKKYHICQNCGEKYLWTDGHPHKFCSIKCLREWQKIHKVESRPKEPVLYNKKCEYCGEEFSTFYSNQKYCSYECSYEANKKQHRDKWSESYVPKTYICKECGSVFTTVCGDTHHTFCCSSCAERYERRIEHQSERHKNYMRKIRRERNKLIVKNYVEEVSYDEVFDRDGGICQICGLPVIYDKHEDNNWSGTIDHIVPLSLNGEHSMKNCQLAHRICNSLKNKNSEKYSIDWNQKAKENNYWRIKYEALKTAIGA